MKLILKYGFAFAAVSFYQSIYYKTSDFFVLLFNVVNVSHLYVQLTSADSLISAQVCSYSFYDQTLKKRQKQKPPKAQTH